MAALAPSDENGSVPMGTGLRLLCGVLLFAAFVGVLQLAIVVVGLRTVPFYREAPNLVPLVSIAAGVLVVKSMMMARAAYLMTYDRRASAVMFTMAAAFFWFPGSSIAIEALTDLVAGRFWRWSTLGHAALFDGAILFGVVPYLLLSRRIQDVYGTKTRRWIMTQLPRFWLKLRGRLPAAHTEN